MKNDDLRPKNQKIWKKITFWVKNRRFPWKINFFFKIFDFCTEKSKISKKVIKCVKIAVFERFLITFHSIPWKLFRFSALKTTNFHGIEWKVIKNRSKTAIFTHFITFARKKVEKSGKMRKLPDFPKSSFLQLFWNSKKVPKMTQKWPQKTPPKPGPGPGGAVFSKLKFTRGQSPKLLKRALQAGFALFGVFGGFWGVRAKIAKMANFADFLQLQKVPKITIFDTFLHLQKNFWQTFKNCDFGAKNRDFRPKNRNLREKNHILRKKIDKKYKNFIANA